MDVKQEVPLEEATEVELIIPTIILEVKEEERNSNQHANECQCRTCEHYRKQQNKKSCDCFDSDNDQFDYLVLCSCSHEENAGCCWLIFECLDGCDCDDGGD